MNRVKSGIFPNTICGVVKQKTQSTCQFSWICEGKFDVKSLTHFNNSLYNSVRELAVYVYANHDKIEDPSRGALFYTRRLCQSKMEKCDLSNTNWSA